MVYYSKTSGIDCQLFIGNVLTFFHKITIQGKQTLGYVGCFPRGGSTGADKNLFFLYQ